MCNSSFELIRNRGNPLGSFRLPVKACRPLPELRLLFYLGLRFKDFVSKHEHGRVKSISHSLPKNSRQSAIFCLASPFLHQEYVHRMDFGSSKKKQNFFASSAWTRPGSEMRQASPQPLLPVVWQRLLPRRRRGLRKCSLRLEARNCLPPKPRGRCFIQRMAGLRGPTTDFADAGKPRMACKLLLD